MSIWIGFLKGDCREGILTKKKKYLKMKIRQKKFFTSIIMLAKKNDE
jgi:hypothetical protein